MPPFSGNMEKPEGGGGSQEPPIRAKVNIHTKFNVGYYVFCKVFFTNARLTLGYPSATLLTLPKMESAAPVDRCHKSASN